MYPGIDVVERHYVGNISSGSVPLSGLGINPLKRSSVDTWIHALARSQFFRQRSLRRCAPTCLSQAFHMSPSRFRWITANTLICLLGFCRKLRREIDAECSAGFHDAQFRTGPGYRLFALTQHQPRQRTLFRALRAAVRTILVPGGHRAWRVLLSGVRTSQLTENVVFRLRPRLNIAGITFLVRQSFIQ